jgi:acetyl esterase/lipase
MKSEDFYRKAAFASRTRVVGAAMLLVLMGVLTTGCAQNPVAASAPKLELTPVSQDQSLVDRLPQKALAERKFMQRPNSWFLAHLDGPRTTLEGQTLNPKLQYKFQERAKERAGKDYNAWLNKVWATSDGRKRLRDAVDVNWTRTAYDVGRIAAIQDTNIPGPASALPARIYRPEGDQPKPALVYFHGGGFLMASYKAVQPQAKILAKEGDIIVVSVNYRLAPEHKFPAAQHDAIAAYRWVVANAVALGIDPDRIGVGGDSAGGNLAAVVTQEQIRAGKSVPKATLFYYPFIDIDFARYDSYDVFGEGFGLDKQFIADASRQLFASPTDKTSPWMHLADSLSFASFPPTIVAIAGFDPLRDQGRTLADKLQRAGVPVVREEYPSLNHGFLELSDVIDAAHDACFDTAREIGRMLRR